LFGGKYSFVGSHGCGGKYSFTGGQTSQTWHVGHFGLIYCEKERMNEKENKLEDVFLE
jgi:hypothetical protein